MVKLNLGSLLKLATSKNIEWNNFYKEEKEKQNILLKV